MINKINIAFLLLFLVSIVACDDEQSEFDGPFLVNINGPDEVNPEDEATFYLGDIANGDSYTWAVEGPAQITSAATGNSVTIKFQSVGDVIVSVANGTITGAQIVSVAEVDPEVSADLNGTGVLRTGVQDTVFLNFSAPLTKDPTISLRSDATTFASGSLGNLVKVDASSYYALYTAGEGNGTPQIIVLGLENTPEFGGGTLNGDTLNIYRVDNVAPVATVSYSPELANDSTEVVVNVQFSEPVHFENPLDSALRISFSGAGVKEETDTLAVTDDATVYTYNYIVNGKGDGPLSVALSNITDLGGNPLAVVNHTATVEIDNTAPIVAGAATDMGAYAQIDLGSSESGTGYYLIVEESADAPTSIEEYMNADNVASGSMSLSMAVPATAVEVLSAGSYTVYYLSSDMAGNYSDITSGSLVMD